MSKFLLKAVQDMDVKTDEFFELYCAVNDKQWNIKNPDEEQKAKILCNMIANRADAKEAILLVKIFKEIIEVSTGRREATSAELGFENKTFYFTVATTPDALDKMKKIVANTVMVQARDPK